MLSAVRVAALTKLPAGTRSAVTRPLSRSVATSLPNINEWLNFKGKVALVTGAATGIGKAAALAYAAAGAKVVVGDFNSKLGQATVDEIKAGGGDALFIQCDVSKEEQVEAMVKGTVSKYGRLDIAFNNAGIVAEMAPIDKCTTAGWQKTMDVNLNSVFFCMRAQAPEMRRVGGGAIINTASIAGLGGGPSMNAYVASKHAVVGLTKVAAFDFAADKIRVNAIAPGYVETPILQSAGITKEALSTIAPTVNPQKRIATPEELAAQILLLSSEKATPYMTGTTIVIDGGQTAGF